MKTQISKLITLAVSSLAAIFVIASAAPVQAGNPSMMCRDCPFPMKVGDGVWIMPNEKLEVHIERIKLPSRFEEVHVVLRDPETHEVLASGISKQRAGRKTVNVQLFDNSGREVKGFVRFIDPDLDTIQAKFTCDSCEIGKLL